MDEIFDRIKSTKINKHYLRLALIYTEILGILVLLWFLRVPLSQKFLTIPAKAYSVISLSPQKRYLLSQGDLLTGKAIPNTTIKVLITPGFLKSSITSDSKGDFWYQIPKDLQKSIHRITFGNFDKKNKLVTFQTYKFRVQSNISLFNITDSVKKKVGNLLKPVNAQIRTGMYPDLYASVGLPPPHIPTTLTEEERFRFRNYFLPHAYTAAKIVGADWRLMAMFTYREDHITNYLDNCLDGNKRFGPDADHDPNTPCTGWGIPQWQVGWGVYPAQWANKKLPEAIAVVRPGKSIQEIGQEVIDNSYNLDMYATFNHPHEKDPITYPERFPDNVTLEEIVEGSQAILNDGKDALEKPTDEEKNLVIGTQTCRPVVDANTNPRQDPKDCYMRQLFGILLKDPAISAYLLASMWKDLYSDQQIINEIQYQWGPGSFQAASDILAGFDNEARGIDFESIAVTPQISMPVAVSAEHQPSAVQTETVVSEAGAALDPNELANKNLIVERVVKPYGWSPYDDLAPMPGQPNVRGASSVEEVLVDPDQLSNPSDYQLCAILKPIDFDVVMDYECLPLDQIIDPQIPVDSANNQATNASSCPIYPDAGEFACAEGVCRSTEYDCSSGRRWYFDEFKNPQNSCEFEAKSNIEGEFAGLWYHGDIDQSCSEQPFQEHVPEPEISPDIPGSYDPDHVDEPAPAPEAPQQEPEQSAAEPENPSLDQTIEFEGN